MCWQLLVATISNVCETGRKIRPFVYIDLKIYNVMIYNDGHKDLQTKLKHLWKDKMVVYDLE
ncbi:hypothetical protein BLOT_007248 [Blomia tropicalis]|nr:hypothetical protein BLOT_007248 [Blomia tropicalis]